MFTCSRVLLGLMVAAGAALVHADPAPNLGKPMTAQQIAAADYLVSFDGSGLPHGSGSVTQGQRLYQRHCLACHGKQGIDGLNDQLAGGHGTLNTPTPVITIGSYWPYATTLFDYVRRAMPYIAPGSLTDDEVYAVTAYLLYINNIVAADLVLSAANLAAIAMPNQQGFVWFVKP